MNYYYSTASEKSTCIILALFALTTSPTSAASVSSAASAFDSTTIIKRAHPAIHLPSMSSSTGVKQGGYNDARGRNASRYYYSDGNDDDGEAAFDDEFELIHLLPPELAALIDSASAKSSPPAAAPTSASIGRYYPTYTDGKSCSIKSYWEFNSWEVYYDTLDECCDKAFSWDYDACMNGK